MAFLPMSSASTANRQPVAASRSRGRHGSLNLDRASLSSRASESSRRTEGAAEMRADDGGDHEGTRPQGRVQRKASQVGQDARLAHQLENASRRGRCHSGSAAKRPCLSRSRDSFLALEARARVSRRGGGGGLTGGNGGGGSRNAEASAAGGAALLSLSAKTGARSECRAQVPGCEIRVQSSVSARAKTVAAHSLLAAAAARSAAGANAARQDADGLGLQAHRPQRQGDSALCRHHQREQQQQQQQDDRHVHCRDADDDDDDQGSAGSEAGMKHATNPTQQSTQIYAGAARQLEVIKYPPLAYRSISLCSAAGCRHGVGAA